MSQEIDRVETRQQMGAIDSVVNGRIVKTPALLTIEETYYRDSERKDVTIKVPRIRVNPKLNSLQTGG